MIRVQPASTGWRTLGVDLYRGSEPEGVSPTWGPAGPESLTFTLARPEGRVAVDLAPFTPVELYPAEDASGDPVWSGYTITAPPGSRAEAGTVTCVGWHVSREDEPGPAFYVHDNLSEWVDSRTLDGITLSDWGFGLTLNAEAALITLGAATGQPWAASKAIGATLDLGPGVGAMRVTGAIQRGPGSPGFVEFYCRAHDAPAGAHMSGGGGGTFDQMFITGLGGITQAAGGAAWALTCTAPRRYVTVFVYLNGANYTPTNDDVWRILNVRAYADAAYESGGASILTADKAMIASRDRFTPYLSKDNSRITATDLPIPHFAWLKQDVTAREIQDRANDYHGYQQGVDALQRVFFRPQPSVPRLQISAQADGVTFKDKSSNDGTEVYNHVNVRGRSGAGAELLVERWLADLIGADERPPVPGFANPSFDVDTSGWTNATRNTTATPAAVRGFLTAPAGANWTYDGTAAMSGGTFFAGRTYRARLYVRVPAFSTVNRPYLVPLRLGTGGDYRENTNALVNPTSVNSFQQASAFWTPRVDAPASTVFLTHRAEGVNLVVDDGTVTELVEGLLGQRGRVKSFTLNVGVPTDPVPMAALGSSFLLAHKGTPFRADVTISADDVVTDLVSGRAVPAGRLGGYYGEMVRILGVPDPDTGALSARDGIIASVNGLSPVSIALDSERRSLEALMARMGVVSG